MQNEQQRNERLWTIAKARAGFKRTLVLYFIVNAMLTAIWYFTSEGHNKYFWPVWPILGWGVGLAFQYFNAYHSNPFLLEEKEYEKLKQNEK